MAFMMALARYDWPFNVRELHAVLRRATALAAPGDTLDTKHLLPELVEPPAETHVRSAAARQSDKPAIPTATELREQLRDHDGNVSALARLLQRDRSLIHRWLRQHEIDPQLYRTGRPA